MADGKRKQRDGMPLRQIAIITGTRAEFGLLLSTLRALRERQQPKYKLIVTGMHLLKKFGQTIEEIKQAGWPIDAIVPMQSETDSDSEQAQAVSRGIGGITQALDTLRCDSVLVLGDRIEAFAGACAGALSRRLVIHIHGGDRAAGDVDESLRNAISRLAHVHLAASREAADRLFRMGEPRNRIYRVGAPGLDDIRPLRHNRQWASQRRREQLDALKLSPHIPYAMVIQHPSGQSAHQEAATARAIVKAVRANGLTGIAIYPNSDPGHDAILNVLRRLQDKSHWAVVPSLPREDYLALAMGAAVLVGNSSSGIIESASLGVPAVNVGNRQQGRLRCGSHVIDCTPKPTAIQQAIARALRMERPRANTSVYGDGQAGQRIADVLQRLIITPEWLHKCLTY